MKIKLYKMRPGEVYGVSIRILEKVVYETLSHTERSAVCYLNLNKNYIDKNKIKR
jgi:hypothetical protein